MGDSKVCLQTPVGTFEGVDGVERIDLDLTSR